MSGKVPQIVLFGYRPSTFTQKIQLALRLRQIPYVFVIVPSMLPRPIFLEYFNLTYRKIPVLAVGKELYIDTSLIMEALHALPDYQDAEKHPKLYPDAKSRTLARLLASHYTDRPLFRLTTGLIPGSVWRTRFGTDREGLIGHKIDPDKLERKIPQNLAALDTYLSVLEPLFAEDARWLLDTETPSGADVSLFYQLNWGEKISRGEGINDLTAAGMKDGIGEGMGAIFSEQRYPGLLRWFNAFQAYINDLPSTETQVIEKDDTAGIAKLMDALHSENQASEPPLLTTPNANTPLDERIGLTTGTEVSVTPDDTGRGEPTVGTLVGSSSEEVIIVPSTLNGKRAKVEGIRFHFPRVGFVVKPVKEGGSKL